MRRKLLLVGVLGATSLLGALVLWPRELPAQPGGKGGLEAGTKAQEPQLPVGQVVLFSSGVGYFQREGEIDGTGRIDLTFPVADINDLLKSMVLQDLGGGHISAVSYDSHDPIEKTLRSFAINLTSNPTYGQILQQARGEKVEVTMQQTNVSQPALLSGTIVGIEKQRQPAGPNAVVEIEMLNLLAADGMRNCKLSDVQRVRFLNPVIDGELRRALETLALSHDSQKKAVSVNFVGQGRRQVRVGYVVEAPIWKTSYRLLLPKASGGAQPRRDEKAPEDKPFLQGWAVVENTTDTDWNNVRMSLVSGRPISFRMDLYAPLYVQRPQVEPELFASLRPPTYTGAMERLKDSVGREDLQRLRETRSAGEAQGRNELGAAMMKKAPAPGGAAGGFGYRGAGVGGDAGFSPVPGITLQQPAMDPRQGVQSAASATEMGDFFQYVIDKPVTLARQKSAMLPIVNQEVQGTRVSIYNQGVHGKFPLLGLKFKNTSGLHLMQGPITVFEGASYAGDARIMDLQPNEDRLLSYAIDLGTEVEPIVEAAGDHIIAIKVVKGYLNATHKVRDSRVWNIKNRSEQDRTVIIEHPYRQEFKLVKPDKASERSRDMYRFEVAVAAGKTAKQEVVEEQDVVQTHQLASIDDEAIRIFLREKSASTKVKDALSKALELKMKLAGTRRELADEQGQLKGITDDQDRLRKNLAATPPTAAAYKRYLEKFDKQETEIEQLQEKIKKLQATELTQRGEYESYLANLEVE